MKHTIYRSWPSTPFRCPPCQDRWRFSVTELLWYGTITYRVFQNSSDCSAAGGELVIKAVDLSAICYFTDGLKWNQMDLITIYKSLGTHGYYNGVHRTASCQHATINIFGIGWVGLCVKGLWWQSVINSWFRYIR